MLTTAQKLLQVARLVVQRTAGDYTHKDVNQLADAFRGITNRTDRKKGLEEAYSEVLKYYKGPQAKMFMEVIDELLKSDKSPSPR